MSDIVLLFEKEFIITWWYFFSGSFVFWATEVWFCQIILTHSWLYLLQLSYDVAVLGLILLVFHSYSGLFKLARGSMMVQVIWNNWFHLRNAYNYIQVKNWLHVLLNTSF